MTDMLVKLYNLKPLQAFIHQQELQNITIRRALVAEKHFVLPWVQKHFSEYWVNECSAAFYHMPVSIFIAIEQGQVIGFACYDVTRLGFFGPTGVDEVARGRGTGAALLMVCLHDMWAQGYGYAIIGGVGPINFYEKICDANVIPDSSPGVYSELLREKTE